LVTITIDHWIGINLRQALPHRFFDMSLYNASIVIRALRRVEAKDPISSLNAIVNVSLSKNVKRIG
jgi:hypothetical protein